MKTRPVVVVWEQTVRRTDVQTSGQRDMTKLIIALPILQTNLKTAAVNTSIVPVSYTCAFYFKNPSTHINSTFSSSMVITCTTCCNS